MSIPALLWARQQEDLGAANKAVLKELAFRLDDATGRCDPSAAQLAKDCCLDISSVRRALRFLAKRSLITVKHRRDPKNHGNLPSEYVVHYQSVSKGGVHSEQGFTVNRGSQRTGVQSEHLFTVTTNRLNTNTNTNTAPARAVIYASKTSDPLPAKAARIGKKFAAELGIGPGTVLQAIQQSCEDALKRGQAEQAILAAFHDAQRRRELIQHKLADAMDDTDFWKQGWRNIAMLEQAAAKQPELSANHAAKRPHAAKRNGNALMGVWDGIASPTHFPDDPKAQEIQDRVEAYSRGEITAKQGPGLREMQYLGEAVAREKAKR